MTNGTLFLVPSPLSPDDDPMRVLPRATIETTLALNYFIAENARSARAVLGRLPMHTPIQQIAIRELDRRTPASALPELLEPLLRGRDAGLISEAGCPAVADPGGPLVALAHQRGVRVVPLVGPSAMLLALMASGMNGQAYAFVGYVPVERNERIARLKALERRSAESGETILFIETPYRNQTLMDAMLASLAPHTLVSVSSALTLPEESVRTMTVEQWRGAEHAVARTPTVFAIQALHRTMAATRKPENQDTGGAGRRGRPTPPAGVIGSGPNRRRR